MAGRGILDRHSDLELVRLCNEGGSRDSARAFEALYARHKDYVIRVAFRFSRDPDIALDVLQDTFTYLLRKFPPTGDGLVLTAQLTSLLYPVAKNSAISHLRKVDRLSSSGVDPDELAADPPGDPGDLLRIVRDLPEERQEVIILRFVDDMSLADIAAALDIPLGTAKSRLHLAIRQLRDVPEIKNLLSP
ncbi:MAG: sigma-70 family RNA polymerase sigma factor [Gammaproteobacteria bacterium]|nr:sigma-70 family RNA polymerase sigma factor [Gammaproteobacteria bacterium]